MSGLTICRKGTLGQSGRASSCPPAPGSERFMMTCFRLTRERRSPGGWAGEGPGRVTTERLSTDWQASPSRPATDHPVHSHWDAVGQRHRVDGEEEGLT